MSKKAHKDKAAAEEAEADPDVFVFSTDVVLNDIQRKVMAVFEVFDQESQKIVDVREVGTMCRAMDLYPSEADVGEIIGIVEEPTVKGMVKMNSFINHMTKVICEGKYKPVPFDDLIAAFRTIDKERKGTLEPVKFKDMLMREGEPFTAEEVDEMLNFAVNKADNLINLEEYAEKLYRALGL